MAKARETPVLSHKKDSCAFEFAKLPEPPGPLNGGLGESMSLVFRLSLPSSVGKMSQAGSGVDLQESG